jgi:hypothetical protein
LGGTLSSPRVRSASPDAPAAYQHIVAKIQFLTSVPRDQALFNII